MSKFSKLTVLTFCVFIPAFCGSVNVEPGGGFSGNGFSPTVLTFSAGSNEILGSNGNAAGIRDYVTFTIPFGFMWTELDMLDTSPLGNVGFIGLEGGNQLTLPTNTMTAAGLLGWHHYVPGDVNTDIFPLMETPANGSFGFTAPLPSGNYTLWIQDSSTGTFNYGFNVQVAAVPEPSTWFTAAAAIPFLAILAWRRHSCLQRRDSSRRDWTRQSSPQAWS